MILLLGVPAVIGFVIASIFGISLVTTAAWMVLASLLGFVTFLVGPMLIRGSVAWGDRYLSMAATVMERFVIVRRKAGGYDLVTASFDGSKGGLEVTLDGETETYADPAGLMSRLCGKHFGVADERFAAITTPLHADIGRVHRRSWVENRNEVSAEMVDEESGEHRRMFGFTKVHGLPKRPRIVDARDWVGVLMGSEEPTDAETAKEYTKKSQAGFRKSVSPAQILMFLGAYGAGIGVPWFLVNYLGGSSGGVGGGTVVVGVAALL